MAGKDKAAQGKGKKEKLEIRLIHSGPSSTEGFINLTEQTEEAAMIHFKRLTVVQALADKLSIEEGDQVILIITKKSGNGKKSEFDLAHAGAGKNKGTVVFTGNKLFKELRLYRRSADELGLEKGDVVETNLEKI